MNKNATATIRTIGFLTLLVSVAAGYWLLTDFNFSDPSVSETFKSEAVTDVPEQDELPKAVSKRARGEYFFRLLRDPATNAIPDNIRQRELKHARTMPTKDQLILKQGTDKGNTTSGLDDFSWRLAGPPSVGGRTRALGIDQRNSDIVIAGGVSGGIWRSTNGGDSWTLRTPDLDSFSVTSLAQDPTSPDTWYYTAGEFDGNSARAPGAPYFGTGVFRSTDNGLTWARVNSDLDELFNSNLDFISRVIVSPTTGTLFISTNGFGVFRSTDRGQTFSNEPVIGTQANQIYSAVDVDSNGRLLAVISELSFDQGNQPNDPGIFVSNDDGLNWTEITPDTFPVQYSRSVATFAPSDPDIIYVFTQKNGDDSNQGVSFHMIDISSDLPGTSADRSANLPDFGDPVGGINTQNDYNMTIAVKPDDPGVVTLGHWNLFRSFDGFATAPTGDTPDQLDEFWIGGYAKANNVNQYPNQHPDQHVQFYDPSNPDRLWVGHDGGLSVTGNVEATDVSWTERNDGYIVTQFYDASIGLEADDPRFLGGTQDNGTPLFEFRDDLDIGVDIDDDISSGDGGFSFFSPNFIFVSNQQGVSENNRVIRLNEDFSGSFAIVQPSASITALFINPYYVDPNDDAIMYYPATDVGAQDGGADDLSTIFRNTIVDEINNQSSGGTTRGWENLSFTQLRVGNIITALEVTTIPADILYYAGSSVNQPPAIRRLDNASSTSEDPVDISIANAPAGAYVHDLAVNPINGNEVLAVMSNYNITGLYHTTDGGNSWTAVEGNLTGGGQQGDLTFGPSLRSATIVPAVSGPIYILGTSTGVYATENLDGDNTQWGRQSPFDSDGNDDIGFSVVENITSRLSDGDVVVGTHGRGMFVGRFGGEIADANIPLISIDPAEGRAGMEVTINATNFQFSSDISRDDITFGQAGLLQDIVEVTPTQLTVIVPRGGVARDAEPNSSGNFPITVIVETDGNGNLTDNFNIIPPNENDLGQNFPNPFSTGDGTNIPISLQNNSSVTLQIYDTTGRLVDETLKDDPFQAGTFNIPVNNFNNFASGVYIYRIIAEPTNPNRDTFVDSRKFTFIR